MTTDNFTAPETAQVVVPAETAKPDVSAYRGPKILLVGCGGCGINVARMISKQTGSNMFFLDTGPGNTFPGENLFVIGSGEGSGGVQDKNAMEAVKRIPSMKIEPDHVPDIAIVCHSLSGGSGSFIGPYVTKHFLSQGIQCVVIGVLDSGSATQAQNTVQSLSNLKTVAEKSGSTVDIMAFDNKSGTLAELNTIIGLKGSALVRLLTAPTMEIDRNDRRHFLDGTATHGAESGLRLINVYAGQIPNDQTQPIFPSTATDVFESVLHIRGRDNGVPVDFPNIPELTHFRKDGYFLEGKIPMLGLVTANLSPLNDPLKKIADLQDRIDTHSKMGTEKLALPAKGKKNTTAGFF